MKKPHILLNKQILMLLDEIDWDIQKTIIDDRYIITSPERDGNWVWLIAYYTETNTLNLLGETGFDNSSCIILDTSISWHKELVEIKLLERL